jgi:hypothetical protein
VVVRIGVGPGVSLPAIGLGGAGLVALSAAQAERLRPLRLAHVRADLRLESAGWDAALERAVANATALGVPLEAALFLPDPPNGALRDLAARAAALQARVHSWLAFRASDATTAEGDVELARAALSGAEGTARFGGGTDRHFAELNRRRAAARGLDRLVFALNPQVHAFDDSTVLENVGSLGALADSMRSFAGGASLAISPVTLRPRSDPRPRSSVDPSEPAWTDDPRQATALAAAWVLAFLASAAEAGFASLTFFELLGPRGVMDDGRAFPVLHALADVAALEGAFVLPSRSRRPERVLALALRSPGRARLFLANVTAETHPVRVDGLAGRLARAPLGAGGAGAEIAGEIELLPYEIARIDILPE